MEGCIAIVDPAGRTLETVTPGKRTETVTNHYAGPGETPVWSTNTSGEVIRNIHGIDGDLVATQTNSETPVLELANLHNDIVATASASETVTKLESKYNTTEFGVPTTSLPPKYSWLGGIELPTELPSGVVAMGARSYVPEIGRFLQPDPRPGGSVNAYAYTYGDPLDQVDPTGEWTFGIPQWLQESDGEWGAREAAVEAARLAAERAEAERIARETAEREEAWEASNAAVLAWVAAGQAEAAAREAEGGEEEYYEEEGEYENASYHPHAENGKEEAHIEPAILVQPLQEGTNSGSGEESAESRIPVLGGCPSTKDPCWKQVGHHHGRQPISNKDVECGLASAAAGVATGAAISGPAAPIGGAVGGLIAGFVCVVVN